MTCTRSKACYENRREARNVLKRMVSSARPLESAGRLHPYRCYAGNWHLGHQIQKRGRA